MGKLEWMQICDECHGADPLCKFDAISKSAQRKLLEYLVKQGFQYPVVMLKQMEEQ
jgi:hypothetical protein